MLHCFLCNDEFTGIDDNLANVFVQILFVLHSFLCSIVL